MLKMPSNASRVGRILGIDPGTNTLGVAELSFDVETLEILNMTAKTLTAAKHTKDFWSNGIHGDRFSRINWLEESLLDILQESDPFQIAIESPFFNRMRPNAFEPLIQIKFAVQRAVQRHSAWRCMYEIDPPTVKKAVGVKGNADKFVVRDGLIAMNLPWTGTAVNMLDEHSIDAGAVAIARFEQMKEELCLR